MYNLPYVSYGIFAFVLAAVGLLAWKKGFRAALASLVLTMATVGIILGLTLVLFDKISPLFDSYLEKHFSGSGTYDYKILANAAKPQIIGVCIAVGFIPVFGCVFGITYPIYRLFKKRDFPMTLKFLGSNSKKVKTRNNKLNKIGAVAATSVTAILTAGLASSATGVAFTTASSYNLFNDAMSWLSYGTSFGFTKDSYSLHRMYDIIPLTKNQTLMNFAKVIAPNSQKQLTPAEIQTIIDDSQYKDFKNILSKSETEEILSFLASPSVDDFDANISYQFAPLGSDVKVLQNVWRPLGNESAETGPQLDVYKYDLQTVQALYDGLGAYFGFDETTKAKIVEWIKDNGIQKFDNTEASRLVKNKTDELTNLKNELTKATTLLSDRKGYSATFKANRNAAIDKAKADFAKVVAQINSYNSMIAPSGAIEQNKQLIANLVQTRTTTANDRDSKGSDFTAFTGYPQSTDPNVEPSMSGQANSSAELQIKISAYNAAESNYNSQASQNAANVSEKTSLETTIKTTDSEIRTLTSQLSAKGDEQTKIDAEVQRLSGELNTKQSELTTATSNKTTAQTLLGNAKSALERSKTELADLQKQSPQDANAINVKQGEVQKNQDTLAEKEKDFNSAVKELESAQKAKEDAQTAYNNALSSQQTISQAYNDLKTKLNTANYNQTSYKARLQSLTDAINTWTKTTEPSLSATKTTTKAYMDKASATAQTKFDAYKQTFDIWKQANAAATKAISDQGDRVAAANQAIVSIKTNMDNYNADIKAIEHATKQQAILDWTENPIETIQGIYISTSLDQEINGLAHNNPAVTFNSGDGTSQTIQGKFIGSTTLENHDIKIDTTTLLGTQVDFDVRKDLDDSIIDNYMFSIPYLEAKTDAKHTEIATTSQDYVLDTGTKTVKSKELNKIDQTTEGKIAVLKFNISENEKGTNDIFIPYRDLKKTQFDKNVESYLDIFKKYLGVDPNQKP